MSMKNLVVGLFAVVFTGVLKADMPSVVPPEACPFELTFCRVGDADDKLQINLVNPTEKAFLIQAEGGVKLGYDFVITNQSGRKRRYASSCLGVDASIDSAHSPYFLFAAKDTYSFVADIPSCEELLKDKVEVWCYVDYRELSNLSICHSTTVSACVADCLIPKDALKTRAPQTLSPTISIPQPPKEPLVEVRYRFYDPQRNPTNLYLYVATRTKQGVLVPDPRQGIKGQVVCEMATTNAASKQVTLTLKGDESRARFYWLLGRDDPDYILCCCECSGEAILPAEVKDIHLLVCSIGCVPLPLDPKINSAAALLAAVEANRSQFVIDVDAVKAARKRWLKEQKLREEEKKEK